MSRDDGILTLELVLDEYDAITEVDEHVEEDIRYNQNQGRFKGAWITGSMAAGRWTKKSDIDVWVYVHGLSDYAYDDLDWHIKGNLEERGITIVTEDGIEREIDVLVLDYPPSKEYATIRLF